MKEKTIIILLVLQLFAGLSYVLQTLNVDFKQDNNTKFTENSGLRA
jgi:hypothetical protein